MIGTLIHRIKEKLPHKNHFSNSSDLKLNDFLKQAVFRSTEALASSERFDWHKIQDMSCVTVKAQQPLEFANDAEVVLFGSGIYTRDIARDSSLLSRLNLDSAR